LVFSCGIGWAGAGWRFAFGFLLRPHLRQGFRRRETLWRDRTGRQENYDATGRLIPWAGAVDSSLQTATFTDYTQNRPYGKYGNILSVFS